MTRRRATAVLAVALVTLSACGSRLTDDERSSVLALRNQQTVNLSSVPARAQTTTPDVPTTAVDTNSGGSTQATGAAAAEAPVSAGTGCASATGGREQTGLTDDAMTIATVADVSGVQPGIFQGAHQGARAAAAYLNSQGGICGRRIDTLLLDDKTDPGGNRAATIDACDRAFVAIGSMSAFDDAGARPGADCGIPDMTAISTNLAKVQAKNTFPIYPTSPRAVPTTNARYIAKRFPQAVKKAALVYLNIAVGKATADARMAAWESEGFKFIYVQPVQILEPNYTTFVTEMRSRGVQYVHLIGDFQNMVRLQKSFRQQGYVPQVRDFDSITYDPDYLQTPEVVDGSFTFINFQPFEDASSIPEMKLFLDWLQRTSPGIDPDSFSLYAWSGFRLFQKLATQIGPDITRAKVLAALQATKTWDGNGLHGPHQIGAKLPTTCNLYLAARNGKFVRMHPASGFDCNGTILRR